MKQHIMTNITSLYYIRIIKKLHKITKKMNLNQYSNELKKYYEKLLINYLYNNNHHLFQNISNTPILQQSKTIWVCWLQGYDNAPLLVKKCIDQIKKYNQNVIVLNLENYHNYVELPEIITEKFSQKKITPTHFSDILRFALLAKHGGLWIDSTYLTFQPLPSDIWKNNFFTLSSQKPIFKKWIPQGKWSCNFIKFNKNDPTPNFIYNVLINYWKNNNKIIDYFLLDYIIRLNYDYNPNFRKQIDQNKALGDNIFFLMDMLSKQQSKEIDTCFNQDTIKIYKLTHRFSLNSVDLHGSYYEKFILNREP